MKCKVISYLLTVLVCGGMNLNNGYIGSSCKENESQRAVISCERLSESKDHVISQINANRINSYDLIAEAAKSQLGVSQDCTMLVTNSLAAVGINFHGAPEQYACLGEWTNDPVPGDIIIYSGHVAIYIGDGQAVHGGWNGYTTTIFSVECANPLIGYIHVNLG